MASQSTRQSFQPVQLLQLGLAGIGGLLLILAVAAIRLHAGAQFGIGGETLLPLSLGLLLLALVLQLKPMASWINQHQRTLALASAWVLILGAGLATTEVYARRIQNFRSFTIDLQYTGYWSRDVLKIWNQSFYQQNREHFTDWPIPIETFNSNKPLPIYLFKPNLRMALHGDKLEPAKSGEQVYWSSNAWGLRGPEFSLEKPAGTIRIVCLGASTTEGVPDDDHETYPYFLQEDLSQLFPTQKIEVINAGFHGQSSDSLLEILRQKVLPLHPDVIIWYEAANNAASDEFLKNTSCPFSYCWLKSYPAWFRWLHGRSALFVLLSKALGWERGLPTPVPHQFDDTGSKPKAERYVDAVRQIVQEGKANGSIVVLSSFVTVAHAGLQFSYKDDPSLFNDLYKDRSPFTAGEVARFYQYFDRQYHKIAKEFGVPYADVAAEFPQDPKYFPMDLYHLNGNGNRILAQLFAQFLAKEVLPELFSRPAEK